MTGGTWHFQQVHGYQAVKTYTCPSCHRPITPGTPHVVAWPDLKPLLSESAVAERRHWHTPCWRREHP